MPPDPFELLRLLSGGDLLPSTDKLIGRPASDTQVDWKQTPFRDLKLIGRGGMGAVVRAHDRPLHYAVTYYVELGDLDRARELVAEGALCPLTPVRTYLLKAHPELRD